jgi:hypothetical protein
MADATTTPLPDEITIGRAQAILKIQIQQDQPVLLIGPPGLGKSAIIAQFVNDHNAAFSARVSAALATKKAKDLPPEGGIITVEELEVDGFYYEMVDLRLGQMDVPDLRGLPILQGEQTLETRPHWFPEEESRTVTLAGPAGDQKVQAPVQTLVFLDEITSAVPVMQAAAYQIVLERKIGQWELPKKTRVLAAGNRLEDNAVVFSMSSALRSRFSILNVRLDQSAWDKWAILNGIDERVLAYIRHKPDMLADYTQLQQQSYPCPRTWEMLSRSLGALPHATDEETIDLMSILAGSVVGQGASLDFTTYIRTWQDLPDIDALLEGRIRYEISDDPSQVDIGVVFALTTAVAMRAAPRYRGKYTEAIFKFANDLPTHLAEFRVRVGRDAIALNRDILSMVFNATDKPNVGSWFAELGSQVSLIDAA